MSLLLWFLLGVWLALLVIAPAEAVWMAIAAMMIVALAWGLEALMHRNDGRNRP
jgi:hypothetical protein